MSVSTTDNSRKINIKINVSGEAEFIIPIFVPKMIDRYSNSKFIYFTPTIPITLSDMKSFILSNKREQNSKDFINIFTNKHELNKLITFIGKTKKTKPITTKDIDNNLIVTNNIETMMYVFFNENNKLIYQGREYPIYDYDWNYKYKLIKTKEKNPDYSIEIELNVLDVQKNSSAEENVRTLCNIRKKRILKTMGFKPTRKTSLNYKKSITQKNGGRKYKKNKYTQRNIIKRRIKIF